jgi:hypothetical protein
MHYSRILEGIVAIISEGGLGHSKFLDPPLVINHSQQQQHFNHHKTQHADYERGSPKATPPRRKQCTSVLVTQSKILGFHHGKKFDFPKNAFNKAIASTTNKGHALYFHHVNHDTQGAPTKLKYLSVVTPTCQGRGCKSLDSHEHRV